MIEWRFGKDFEANFRYFLFMGLMCQADMARGSKWALPRFPWKHRGEDLVRRRIAKRSMKMRLFRFDPVPF